MDIGIEGLEAFIKKLEAAGNDVDGALKRGIDKTARRIKRDAKLLAPTAIKDGGRLKGSIVSETTINGQKVEGVVFTPVEYAAYVEYGTGKRGAASPVESKPEGLAYKTEWAGMKAQPYLYPALKKNKDNAEKDLKAEIVKVIGGK